MEKMMGFDKKAQLINELLEGFECAKELRNQISCSSSSSSTSLRDDNQALNFSLLEKMLSSFDKTITIAKLLHIQATQDPSIINNNPNTSGYLDSLHSFSPKSENSHPNFHPSKKRRSMMPKWTKTVKISNNGGLEGALNDGFSWRKYGQKEILGAKFPREYYRCTHRHTRGCAATKHVQRSDEDLSIYQIMYKGEHTCTQEAQLVQAQIEPIFQAQLKPEPQPQPTLSPQQEVFVNLGQQEVYMGLGPEGDLKVGPEQELDNGPQIFRSFSFTQAHLQPDPIDDNYMLSFSPANPAIGSPTTSGSNCLPMSPYHAIGNHAALSVQTPESDINEAGSGPNSVSNSHVMLGGCDFEFPLDELLDLGGIFSYDNL